MAATAQLAQRSEDLRSRHERPPSVVEANRADGLHVFDRYAEGAQRVAYRTERSTPRDYFTEISDGLRAIDPDLRPLRLTASKKTLRDRILARPANEGPHGWPLYRLRDRAPIVQAMLAAARTHHKPDSAPIVCGSSNIGNYFATHEIDATCGFGVTYENLHAPNERIKLNTIQMTSDVYTTAMHSLLTSTAAPLPTHERPALSAPASMTDRPPTISSPSRRWRPANRWHEPRTSRPSATPC